MIAGDVIEDALRKIGVVAQDEPMNADQSAAGLRAFSRFLRSLQNREPDLWLVSSGDVTLTTDASYSPLPEYPRRVISARLIRNGIETPMMELTREEYDSLPMKSSTGTPTTWYFDRQRGDGTLYIWPILAAANGEVIRLTYERPVRVPANVGDTVDAPDEWEEPLVYGLAARLADDYDTASQYPALYRGVTARAEEELRLVLARDREGSLYFGDPG